MGRNTPHPRRSAGQTIRHGLDLIARESRADDEDIACVEGFFVHVAVDPDTRPTPIPHTARARLEGIMVKG